VRAAPEPLSAPTISGGVPGPGVVEEGVIEVKEAFQAARNVQNGFPHLLTSKTPKAPFFTYKYLKQIKLPKFFMRKTLI
jgi:hypothetical protein